MLGSICIMAPEQFERITLDGRTDLYSPQHGINSGLHRDHCLSFGNREERRVALERLQGAIAVTIQDEQLTGFPANAALIDFDGFEQVDPFSGEPVLTL